VGLIGYAAGRPFGYGWDAFPGSESADGAGEVDEEEDVAEELEGGGLWGVWGGVGVCCLSDMSYAMSHEAGCGVDLCAFRDELAPV